MIQELDEQLRPLGLNVSTPIEGRKLQLKIKAMNQQKKIEVLPQHKTDKPNNDIVASHSQIQNESSSQDSHYNINKSVVLNLSYGPTKITVQGFYRGRLGGKSLAFYNDLSLKKLFESDGTCKVECQLLGENRHHVASLYLQMRRDGEAVPNYSLFAEMANRIQINKEQQMAQNPAFEKEMKDQIKKQKEESKADDADAPLPAMTMKNLTEAFLQFVSRIGPLVDAWEMIFGLMTIKDTKDTLAFLMVASYVIIYQETMFLLAPLFPVGVILFIFHNYYYEVKFKRPRNNYVRNMKLIQAIMHLTGEMIEMQHYFVEHFFYWKSKEKTLMTLNICLLKILLLIPLMVIPVRYFIVIGLWGIVALSSPFCVACGQAIIQILLEYGILMERHLPVYMNELHDRLENSVWIPRIFYIMSWIPFVKRFVPSRLNLTKVEKQPQDRKQSLSGEYQPQKLDRKTLTELKQNQMMIEEQEKQLLEGSGSDISEDENEMFNFLDAFDTYHEGQDSGMSDDEHLDDQYRCDTVYGGVNNIDLNDKVFKNKEIRKFETYENQRVWMGIFNDKLLPHERPGWSDKDGKIKLPKDAILLPLDGGWQWEVNWCIEKDQQFQDKRGWSYAYDFNGPFKKQRGLLDFVRRRKWVRIATRAQKPDQSLKNTMISDSGSKMGKRTISVNQNPNEFTSVSQSFAPSSDQVGRGQSMMVPSGGLSAHIQDQHIAASVIDNKKNK